MKRKHRRIHNTAPRELPPRLRTALIVAGSLIVLLLLLLLLRPRTQIMGSAEIAAIQSRGVLRVALLSDAPGLSFEGDGLEATLARALAQELFPDTDPMFSLESVPVTEQTALPKLNAGNVDLILARMRNTGSESYAYSAPYYQDPVYFYCPPQNVGLPIGSQHVGVVQKSGESELIAAFNEQHSANLQMLLYGSYPDLIAALASGDCAFIAMPTTVARKLGVDALTRHPQPLGTLDYVAVTDADTPAIALFASVLIDEYGRNGRIAQLYRDYGLTQLEVNP